MSPMPKGRVTAGGREETTELRSRRKRRVLGKQEDFVRAFLDALRDILHDELRPTA